MISKKKVRVRRAPHILTYSNNNATTTTKNNNKNTREGKEVERQAFKNTRARTRLLQIEKTSRTETTMKRKTNASRSRRLPNNDEKTCTTQYTVDDKSQTTRAPHFIAVAFADSRKRLLCNGNFPSPFET